jgi:hypothetical protein
MAIPTQVTFDAADPVALARLWAAGVEGHVEKLLAAGAGAQRRAEGTAGTGW